MARIVIIIAILAVALLMWFKIKNAKGEERKKLIIWTIAGIAIAVLGVLAATGRLNIITAAIGGLIALLPKLVNVLRYLPLINRFQAVTFTLIVMQWCKLRSKAASPNRSHFRSGVANDGMLIISTPCWNEI